MRLPCLIAVLLGLGVRPAASQTCTDPHYRWTEKVDESLASITPVRTTIRAMITTWGLPAFTGQAQYKCADREGRELRVYSLLGWVRRVKTAEDDGPTRRDQTDGAHGRCNSSARALWELHPVYWIRQP